MKRKQLTCLALTLCICTLSIGCREHESAAPAVSIKHEVAPQPPKIGQATIAINLDDLAGKPVTGAHVKLEGNMSHPGMSPVFADAKEVGEGRYEATIELTMGGDWVIIAYITLPNGQKLERQFDIKGVQSG